MVTTNLLIVRVVGTEERVRADGCAVSAVVSASSLPLLLLSSGCLPHLPCCRPHRPLLRGAPDHSRAPAHHPGPAVLRHHVRLASKQHATDSCMLCAAQMSWLRCIHCMHPPCVHRMPVHPALSPRPAPTRYWAAGLNPAASAFFIFVALIICEVRRRCCLS